MHDLEAELKSLKLFGMASSYAEAADQGGARLQSSEWLYMDTSRFASKNHLWLLGTTASVYPAC